MRACLTALFVSVLVGTTFAQVQTRQLRGLKKRHPRLALSQEALEGEVHYDLTRKQVNFTWFYKGSKQQNLMAYQDVPVAFWPTEVAAYGEDQILVAGLEWVSGKSIVERWTLAPPDPMPRARVNSISGEVMEPNLAVKIASKEPVLRSDLGTIRSMFRLQGTASTVLLHFWESKELYTFDLGSGQLERLFIPVADPDDPDVPVLPELAAVHGGRWSATHRIEGHLYKLGSIDDNATCLILADVDLDGKIDTQGAVTIEEFRAKRLGDGEQYSAWTVPDSARAQNQVPRPLPLFEGLKKRRSNLQLSQDELRGEAFHSMSEREVHFLWLYKGSQGQNWMSYQDESVSFWPTEVATYGENQILVAGRDPVSGQSIVERWTLTPPSPMPLARVDPTTGEIVEPYIAVKIASKDLVLRSDLGTIRSVFRLQGTASTVLLHFWESKELYTFDLGSGELKRLFIPVADPDDPDVPVLPELTVVHGGRWSATHTVEGHLYMLGGIDDDATSLILADVDLDGKIDTQGAVTIEEFWAKGLDKADQYSAFY
jgi:hypothetical protein